MILYIKRFVYKKLYGKAWVIGKICTTLFVMSAFAYLQQDCNLIKKSGKLMFGRTVILLVNVKNKSSTYFVTLKC